MASKRMRISSSSSNNISMPCDLILDILVRLPAKSLTRFQSLSKCWSQKIKSPVFVETHHRRCRQENPALIIERSHWTHMMDVFFGIDQIVLESKPTELEFHSPGRFFIAGVCKGLICFADSEDELTVMLWNPAIRQIKRIPEPSKRGANYYGFCFNSADNDFKVVSLFFRFGRVRPRKIPVIKAYVYSVRAGAWKDVGGFQCEDMINNEDDKSVAVNGVLYWKAKKTKRVISFDTNSDVFKTITIPKSLKSSSVYKKLTAYKDAIALLACEQSESEPIYIDLWVMDDKIDCEDSGKCWKKEKTIGPFAAFERPIGIWRDEILIANYDLVHGLRGFKAWLPDREGCDSDDEIGNVTYDVYDYSESLIQVCDGNEMMLNLEEEDEGSMILPKITYDYMH